MKKNYEGGFTLIELLVVVIILGILAVTAAPKFMSLTGDARASTVKGMKGAVQGSLGLVFAKAQVSGQSGLAGTLTIDGNAVTLEEGYPDPAAAANLSGVVEFDPLEFTAVAIAPDEIVIHPVGANTGAATVSADYVCAVVYTKVLGDSPSVTFNVADCD